MSSILIILAELVAITGLILFFYNLKSRFGFAPLFILIGVNQFFQSIIATSFFIKYSDWFIFSPGSVILFCASLFVVLLIYIKEGTRITQHFIVGIVLANFSYSLLNWITQQQGNILSDLIAFRGAGLGLLNINYRAFFTGTVLLLVDAFVIVILYEFLVRVRRMNLFLRLLVTMLVVLNLDGILFTILAFGFDSDLELWIVSQVISKSIAALFFASILWFYLQYLDKDKEIPGRKARRGKEDIFSILTYKGRFERLQTEKALSDEILQKAITEKTGELESAIHRFTVLSSVSELRMDKFSPEELAREFLRKVKEAFEVDACTIHVLKNEDLELLASVGVAKEHKDKVLVNIMPYLPEMIQNKKSIFIYDVTANAQSAADDENDGATFFYKSCAGAPLIIGDQVKGILKLYSIHEKRAFIPIEMEQLQLFAVQLAQSIENSRLFHQNEKHKEVLVKQIIARKKAEESITKSEANFRILFNQTAVLIWEADLSEIKVSIDALKQKGVKDLGSHFRNNQNDLEECATLIKVISMNDKSREFFNVTSFDDWIQNIPAVFTTESWNAFRELMVAIGSGNSYIEGEIPIISPGGDIKHLYINIAVPPGYTHTLEKVIVSFVDVTDRKNAEFEIIRSKEQFQNLIENITGVYWVTNLATNKMEYISSSYENIYGRKREVLNDNPSDFINCIHPDDREYVIGEYQKNMKSPKPVFLTMRILKPGGEIRWIQVKTNVVTDASGKMKEYGYSEDITDRRRNEEERQLLLQRNKQTIETMIDGFILANESGQIIDVNPAYCNMVEYTRKELLGKYINEIEATLTSEQVGGRIAEMMEKRAVKFETRHRKKNGKMVDMSVHISIMIFEGKPLVAAFVRDITEQKLVEQKLAEQKEELRNLASHLQTIREEERTHISREIHDELGQQLTIVKMNIHSLSKKNKEFKPEIKEQLHAISESVNSTIDTVRKIASELRPVILDEQGLADALKWQVSEFKRRTGISASIVIDSEGENSDVKTNTQIFRIFQEALTNIARHAQATKVQAILKNENGCLKLLISDDGIGFDSGDIAQKKSLGLIMMRERATSIGATLTVISQPGQGTSFLLSKQINE